MIDISIIIVSYNTRNLLRKCLNSISTTVKPLAYEVIVVDNNSQDGSVALVKNEFPWVRLIANIENKGFAAANNQGLRIAQGNFIVLLNPDTVVLPNAFKNAYNFLEKNENIGALGCQLLNPDKTLQISCASAFPTLGFVIGRFLVRATGVSFVFDHFFPNIHYPFKWWYTPNDHQSSREVALITGACLWIRKEVIDKVGLLDERYFMYLEDTELCYRIKKDGWKIYYLPSAQIIHVQHASSRKSQSFFYGDQEFFFYRNRLIFFKTHHSHWELVCYRILVILSALAKLALSVLLFLINHDEMKIRVRAYLKVIRLSLSFR